MQVIEKKIFFSNVEIYRDGDGKVYGGVLDVHCKLPFDLVSTLRMIDRCTMGDSFFHGVSCDVFVIEPNFDCVDCREVWENSIRNSERAFKKLLELGAPIEEAKKVLSLSLSISVDMSSSLYDWVIFLRKAMLHEESKKFAQDLLKKLEKEATEVYDFFNRKGITVGDGGEK